MYTPARVRKSGERGPRPRACAFLAGRSALLLRAQLPQADQGEPVQRHQILGDAQSERRGGFDDLLLLPLRQPEVDPGVAPRAQAQVVQGEVAEGAGPVEPFADGEGVPGRPGQAGQETDSGPSTRPFVRLR